MVIITANKYIAFKNVKWIIVNMTKFTNNAVNEKVYPL